VGFKNVEADRIMDQARLEFDEPKRVALYHRFDAILHEEQPYTFLFCIQELEALDKRFQNVKVYKFGLDSREWYVPANQQRYR
jgi:peptide/nickel transport system substrate-binding protein